MKIDGLNKIYGNITESREYGASYACVELMKELGLDKIIHSHNREEWVCAALAMIAGRLVYAGSKLSLSHCTSFSALWEVGGGIDKEIYVNVHCYNAMDKLFGRQKAIQKAPLRSIWSPTLLIIPELQMFTQNILDNQNTHGIMNNSYNK